MATAIYWKLDIFSCLYIPRNKPWFASALPKIQEFWEKIVEEREIPESYLKYKAKTRTPNKSTEQKTSNVIVLG